MMTCENIREDFINKWVDHWKKICVCVCVRGGLYKVLLDMNTEFAGTVTNYMEHSPSEANNHSVRKCPAFYGT